MSSGMQSREKLNVESRKWAEIPFIKSRLYVCTSHKQGQAGDSLRAIWRNSVPRTACSCFPLPKWKLGQNFTEELAVFAAEIPAHNKAALGLHWPCIDPSYSSGTAFGLLVDRNQDSGADPEDSNKPDCRMRMGLESHVKEIGADLPKTVRVR